MNNNSAQRNRIMINAMRKDEPIATYPLPICDVHNTLHTLIGLFPLSTLKQLSKGLADAVEVIERCGSEPFQLSTPAISTHPDSSLTTPRVRITDAVRGDVIKRRQDGQPLTQIAAALGLKYSTVQAIALKAKRKGIEPSASK